MSNPNNLISCNNLSVLNNLSVNGTITSSSDMSLTGNISTHDINSSGNCITNNLTLTGKINNFVSPTNILSLDTTTSIQTRFNTDETNIANNTSSINTINGQITTINGRLDTDETNIATNTANITKINNNYKINADNTTPYITAELSRNNGFIINDTETLQTTLGSTNTIESLTQNVGSSNQYYLNSYTYRHTDGSGWQNASIRIGNKVDTTNTGYIEFNPKNYLYGVGIYGGTQTGKYGITVATDGKVNVNTSNTIGLETNTSGIHCADLYFNYTDPILGNNTSGLSQRWTAMYQTVQNNIDISNTNSTNITTLQNQVVSLTSQINALKLLAPKAYGYWNGSSWTVGSQFILQSNLGSGAGLYGLKFWLQGVVPIDIKGILTVTPDGNYGGYTAQSRYLGMTAIDNSMNIAVGCIVQMYNGGAQPTTQSTMSFYYQLI